MTIGSAFLCFCAIASLCAFAGCIFLSRSNITQRGVHSFWLYILGFLLFAVYGITAYELGRYSERGAPQTIYDLPLTTTITIDPGDTPRLIGDGQYLVRVFRDGKLVDFQCRKRLKPGKTYLAMRDVDTELRTLFEYEPSTIVEGPPVRVIK